MSTPQPWIGINTNIVGLARSHVSLNFGRIRRVNFTCTGVAAAAIVRVAAIMEAGDVSMR